MFAAHSVYQDELRKRCLDARGVHFAKFGWEPMNGCLAIFVKNKITGEWSPDDLITTDGGEARQPTHRDVDVFMSRLYGQGRYTSGGGNGQHAGWYKDMVARREAQKEAEMDSFIDDAMQAEKAAARAQGEDKMCDHGDIMAHCDWCKPKPIHYFMGAPSGEATNGKFKLVINDKRRNFN